MNLNEKEADSWVDSLRELLSPMLFDPVEVKTYVRKSDINDRYRCVQCTDENKDALYRWIIYNGGEVDITINNKKAVLYLHTPSSRVSIDPTDYVTLDSDGIFRMCLSYVFEDSFEEMTKEPIHTENDLVKIYTESPVKAECVQFTKENRESICNWIRSLGYVAHSGIDLAGIPVIFMHNHQESDFDFRMTVHAGDYIIHDLDTSTKFYFCFSDLFSHIFKVKEKKSTFDLLFDDCFTKTKRISYAIFNKETKNDIIEYLGSHNYYSDISTDDNGDPYLVFCEKHRSPIIGTPAAIGDYIVQNKDDSFISYTPEEFHNLYTV